MGYDSETRTLTVSTKGNFKTDINLDTTPIVSVARAHVKAGSSAENGEITPIEYVYNIDSDQVQEIPDQIGTNGVTFGTDTPMTEATAQALRDLGFNKESQRDPKTGAVVWSAGYSGEVIEVSAEGVTIQLARSGQKRRIPWSFTAGGTKVYITGRSNFGPSGWRLSEVDKIRDQRTADDISAWHESIY